MRVLWVAERKQIDGVDYMTSSGEEISLSQPPSPSERVVITKAATPKPVRSISPSVVLFQCSIGDLIAD